VLRQVAMNSYPTLATRTKTWRGGAPSASSWWCGDSGPGAHPAALRRRFARRDRWRCVDNDRPATRRPGAAPGPRRPHAHRCGWCGAAGAGRALGVGEQRSPLAILASPRVHFSDGSALTSAAVIDALTGSCGAGCPWTEVHAVGSTVIFTGDSPLPNLPVLLAGDDLLIARAGSILQAQAHSPDRSSAREPFSRSASRMETSLSLRMTPAGRAGPLWTRSRSPATRPSANSGST